MITEDEYRAMEVDFGPPKKEVKIPKYWTPSERAGLVFGAPFILIFVALLACLVFCFIPLVLLKIILMGGEK